MATPRIPAVLVLLLIQVVVGYEWLVSGFSKVANGDFAGGLHSQLAEMAHGAPAWYAGFLRDVVLPHSVAFAYAIEVSEVAVGAVLVATAVAVIAGRPSRGLARASAVACIAGVVMAVNFELANGGSFGLQLARDSFDEGVDLDTVIIGVQLALLAGVLASLRVAEAPRPISNRRRTGMSKQQRAVVSAIVGATSIVAIATWQTISHLPSTTAAAAAPHRVAAPAKAKPKMNMAPQAARKVPYGTTPLRYTLDHGVKVFQLVAQRARWRVDASTVVSAWTYNGQVPGPLLRFRQGDTVRIVVTNRLPEPTAVHWHGLGVPNAMDGVPGVTMKPIARGRTFTYQFKVTNAPGLFLYHPHYDTLKQESSGMYGALIVDPRTGPPADVHEMIQVLSTFNGQYLINGKSFPATDTYSFPQSSKVLIRTINADVMNNHPMHLHGFSFREVGMNGGAVPRRLQFPMFEQDIAPGETFDQLFVADHKGVWLYHCHNLMHVTGPNGTDAGMITAFKVVAAT